MNTFLGAVGAVSGIAALILALWKWKRGVSKTARKREAQLDERRAVTEFAAFLHDKRVLFATEEYWDEVVDSVDRIRTKASDVQPRMVNPGTRETVEKVRTACRELMDAPRNPSDANHASATDALRAFRRQVRPALDKLCRVYSLPHFGPKPESGIPFIHFGGLGQALETIYVPGPDDEPDGPDSPH